MNRNKEYRLKRKAQRKDYIIQDKNLTIKTLYYRNETKRNKIEQLEQENQQLKEQLKDENTYCEEANKWYKEAFQLQNNWNELKNRTQKKIEQLEHFNEQLKTSPYTPQIETLKLTLKDMQELEQGKDG